MASTMNPSELRILKHSRPNLFWFWAAFAVGLVVVWVALQKRRRWSGGDPARLWRPAEPVAEPASAPAPSPATPPAPDDLRRIRGVGPKTAQLLNEHGIYTFEQLASANPADLSAWLAARGWRMIDPSDWPEQARRLVEAVNN